MTEYRVVATFSRGTCPSEAGIMATERAVGLESRASASGHPEIVLVLEATDLQGAVELSGGMLAALTPIGLEIVPTSVWRSRARSQHVPDLLSVSDAARLLGVTRQSVLQRIDTGSLSAIRVGHGWVIPRSAAIPAGR